MHQTTLFDVRDWDRLADDWIAEHPEAFGLFCRIALEYADAGRRIRAKAIVERMRWETGSVVGRQDTYKYNNNYTARLARRAIDRHPQLRHTITRRRRPADV